MNDLLKFGFKKIRFKKISTENKIKENKTQTQLTGGEFVCAVTGHAWESKQHHDKMCKMKYCKTWDFYNHCDKKESEKQYGV